MTMPIEYVVIIVSFIYLIALFLIAGWAEKNSEKKWLNSPVIYALSMAVYCTAWTYYGSVGRAANQGLDFLTTYIGPILVAPLFWIVTRKLIRICKVQRLTTIADFIAARYGKSVFLGAFVSLICVLAIIPYMSIQLKAISYSFSIFSDEKLNNENLFFTDTAFYITIILGLFAVFFGARKVDASKSNIGLVTVIAFESLFKLFAFVLLGIYVTFGIFNGFADIFNAASSLPAYEQLTTLKRDDGYTDWFWLNALSMFAIILLPRQFHVSVKENRDENHLKKAIWLFPLYLLLINIFVIPIALGGTIFFQDTGVNADTYVIAMPLAQNNVFLALIVYLGGFSAATSMIIVSTTALSVMLSNNILIPSILKSEKLAQQFKLNINKLVVWGRYIMVFIMLLAAYLYFKFVGQRFSLVSVGLISFVGVAQFAPSVLGGMFWKGGNRKGAISGLMVGLIIWIFMLIVPTMVEAQIIANDVLISGLFGINWLTPSAFLGLEADNIIVQGFMWSLLFNTLAYVSISTITQRSTSETNQAEVFVDIFKYSAVYESSIFWKGKAFIQDIKNLLYSFLGKERTERAFKRFQNRNAIEDSNIEADFRVVNYAEKLLAGAVGSASARVLMSSIVKEEKMNINEVFGILHETQKYISDNKELKEKSFELEEASLKLKKANDELTRMDKLKDEFISTVTHEMRTPITSIRAFSEILNEHDELEESEREKFLGTIVDETKRMDRLINQVLDLEKMQSGKITFDLSNLQINDLIRESINSVEAILKEKDITLELDIDDSIPLVKANRDRVKQVLINLLSNAIKFCDTNEGIIKVKSFKKGDQVLISVEDNGKGVSEESRNQIFQPFYQDENQNLKKPEGSGLGLTISRKIIELHNGSIWYDHMEGRGAIITFSIPKVNS